MYLWISVALTVVNLACVLIALSAVRRSSAQQLQIRDLLGKLSAERGRIATHDAELDQITDTLRKLSGRIGAARKEARNAGSPNEPGEDPNISRLTWKAEMREKYGIGAQPLR